MEALRLPIPVPVRPLQKSGQNKTTRELSQLQRRVHDAFALLSSSQLASALNTISRSQTPITKILSLGLGSLTAQQAKEHLPRRIKQLALLLAIASWLAQASETPIELYAQDPAFGRTDEALLASFGVRVLRTSSFSDLGEAGGVIDDATLVYTPFLTVDAYELLLNSSSPVGYWVGDDFTALQQKWPKHSPEKKQLDGLVKRAVSKYQRRPIKFSGFWEEDDKSFPLVVYSLGKATKSRI